MIEAIIGAGNKVQKLALKLFQPLLTNQLFLYFESKLQNAKKCQKICMKTFWCNMIVYTTILTDFETEFKLNK